MLSVLPVILTISAVATTASATALNQPTATKPSATVAVATLTLAATATEPSATVTVAALALAAATAAEPSATVAVAALALAAAAEPSATVTVAALALAAAVDTTADAATHAAGFASRRVRGHLENGVVREAVTEGQLLQVQGGGMPEDLRVLPAGVGIALAATDAAAHPSAAE